MKKLLIVAAVVACSAVSMVSIFAAPAACGGIGYGTCPISYQQTTNCSNGQTICVYQYNSFSGAGTGQLSLINLGQKNNFYYNCTGGQWNTVQGGCNAGGTGGACVYQCQN